MRILALATHPIEGASTRYRVLSYVPFLERQGYTVRFSPFFPSPALETIYRPGRPWSKLVSLVRGAQARARLLAEGGFDVLLIHRELFPLGWTPFLSRLRRRRFAVVYDYDDAMFLPQRRDRRLLGKLETPGGTRRLMAASDVVIAGNRYLVEYATRHAPLVVHIPTSIDTEKIVPAHGSGADRCVLGWIGSHTTEKYLAGLVPALAKLASSHRFSLKVVGATRPFAIPGANVVQPPWRLETEIAEFQTCDVGIYPLWDDDWARGKCGFKAIQFMAVGAPVVASAVGANRDIIQDGVNGFLARTEGEWCESLARLIDDRYLRRKIGAAGRETVEREYSIAVNAPKLLEALTMAAAAAAGR